jgi:hypothetical protein
MATLLKVLNNLADIQSAGGVALRVRTQVVCSSSGDGGPQAHSPPRFLPGAARIRRVDADAAAGMVADPPQVLAQEHRCQRRHMAVSTREAPAAAPVVDHENRGTAWYQAWRPAGPCAANRAARLLSTLFNYAIKKTDPDLLGNPCAAIDLFPERLKREVLPFDQLPAWWAAVNALPN